MHHHDTDDQRGILPDHSDVPAAPTLKGAAGKGILIPGLFGVVVIFFFLNFCAFRGGGVEGITVKGIDLVIGTRLKPEGEAMAVLTNSMDDGPGGQSSARGTERGYLPPSILAILAFAAAIAGAAGFALGGEKDALIGIIAGTMGVISLLILQWMIRNNLETRGAGMITPDATFLVGYWAAFLAFLAAAGTSCLRLGTGSDAEMRRTPTIPSSSTAIHISIISQNEDTPSK